MTPYELEEIFASIGKAVWHLQFLEDVLVTYVTMRLRIKRDCETLARCSRSRCSEGGGGLAQRSLVASEVTATDRPSPPTHQAQHVGPQHALAAAGFCARTNALMNRPSTWASAPSSASPACSRKLLRIGPHVRRGSPTSKSSSSTKPPRATANRPCASWRTRAATSPRFLLPRSQRRRACRKCESAGDEHLLVLPVRHGAARNRRQGLR
jgi:hypothetical protein